MSELSTQPEVKFVANDGKKLNLRLKNVAGQMVIIEDVLDYTIDSLALRATYRDTTKTKVGDKIEDVSTIKKMWFNVTLLLTVDEEWK